MYDVVLLLTKTRTLRHSSNTTVVTCVYFWTPCEKMVSIWWHLWHQSNVLIVNFEYIQQVNLFLLLPHLNMNLHDRKHFLCYDFDFSNSNRIEPRCYLKSLSINLLTIDWIYKRLTIFQILLYISPNFYFRW